MSVVQWYSIFTVCQVSWKGRKNTPEMGACIGPGRNHTTGNAGTARIVRDILLHRAGCGGPRVRPRQHGMGIDLMSVTRPPQPRGKAAGQDDIAALSSPISAESQPPHHTTR